MIPIKSYRYFRHKNRGLSSHRTGGVGGFVKDTSWLDHPSIYLEVPLPSIVLKSKKKRKNKSLKKSPPHLKESKAPIPCKHSATGRLGSMELSPWGPPNKTRQRSLETGANEVLGFVGRSAVFPKKGATHPEKKHTPFASPLANYVKGSLYSLLVKVIGVCSKGVLKQPKSFSFGGTPTKTKEPLKKKCLENDFVFEMVPFQGTC